MKKILFIVGTLNLGGIERLTKDIAIALKRTGDWEPAICCILAREGPFMADVEAEGIQVFQCPLSSSGVIPFFLRLSRIVREFRPNLVHSHVSFSIPWQVLGIKLAGVNKIIFTQHNDYQYWKKHFLARLRIIFYFWMSWPFISAYTAVSQCVQQSIASLVVRPTSDFLVIYNPVDTSVFQPRPDMRAAIRRSIGVDKDKFVVGTVARFSEQKGHRFLVQAAALLVKEHPEFHFILIGDGPLRQSIEVQVHQAGLADKFTFLGAVIDVHNYYSGFDVFALPSLWEGFPIVLVEAMSCALPIVATNVGGVAEAINDDCGLLITPGDLNHLVDALRKLKHQPGDAHRLGKAARENVVERFSLESILMQYINLYAHTLYGDLSNEGYDFK